MVLGVVSDATLSDVSFVLEPESALSALSSDDTGELALEDVLSASDFPSSPSPSGREGAPSGVAIWTTVGGVVSTVPPWGLGGGDRETGRAGGGISASMLYIPLIFLYCSTCNERMYG